MDMIVTPDCPECGGTGEVPMRTSEPWSVFNSRHCGACLRRWDDANPLPPPPPDPRDLEIAQLRTQHERDTALCAQAAEDVANITAECVRQLATLTAERDALAARVRELEAEAGAELDQLAATWQKEADRLERERDAARNALTLALSALRECAAALPPPVDGVTPPLDATRATGLALGLAAAVAMVERVAGDDGPRCHDAPGSRPRVCADEGEHCPCVRQRGVCCDCGAKRGEEGEVPAPAPRFTGETDSCLCFRHGHRHHKCEAR